MTEQDPQTNWVRIYELQRWNDEARRMIMENESTIQQLKADSNKNEKDNDNG